MKLERLAESGSWLAMQETEKVKEYEAALEKIVGLDYDEYVQAVMLPQGAFDGYVRLCLCLILLLSSGGP